MRETQLPENAKWEGQAFNPGATQKAQENLAVTSLFLHSGCKVA